MLKAQRHAVDRIVQRYRRLGAVVFFRPFGTVRRADQAMMDAWYDLVGADDTIIYLGDVSVDGSVQAYHQCWWREAPGIKWLVLGNHDVDPVNHVRPLEVEGTAVTLVAPGDPPLLLTHVPLLQVPPGWVNIHGHVHQQESPSRNRHINVSVHREDARHHYEMSQRAVRAAGGAARRAPFSKILLDNFLTAGCRRSGMTATAALRRPQRPAAARIRGK